MLVPERFAYVFGGYDDGTPEPGAERSGRNSVEVGTGPRLE